MCSRSRAPLAEHARTPPSTPGTQGTQQDPRAGPLFSRESSTAPCVDFEPDGFPGNVWHVHSTSVKPAKPAVQPAISRHVQAVRECGMFSVPRPSARRRSSVVIEHMASSDDPRTMIAGIRGSDPPTMLVRLAFVARSNVDRGTRHGGTASSRAMIRHVNYVPRLRFGATVDRNGPAALDGRQRRLVHLSH